MEREGIEVDVTVAAEPLAPGDIALRVPEHLIVSCCCCCCCGGRCLLWDSDHCLSSLLLVGSRLAQSRRSSCACQRAPGLRCVVVGWVLERGAWSVRVSTLNAPVALQRVCLPH